MKFVRGIKDWEYVPSDAGGSACVGWRAFTCRKTDNGLSFHLMSQEMAMDRCAQYRMDRPYEHQDGVLYPCICFVTGDQFKEESVGMALPVVVDDSTRDPKYGHLHYESACPDKRQSQRLAFYATQNKILQPILHPIKGQKPKRL
jgi:hypothetical protein